MQVSSTRHSGNNFDFIRFVAASLVIITHSRALLGLGDADLLYSLSKGTMLFSHFGVAVFFTISGYLIAQSLATSRSYRSYLWKRSLRIFPGLITVLLLIVFLLGPIVTSLPLRAYFSSSQTYSVLLTVSMYKLNVILPGVFTSNFSTAVDGSLWTLAYEFSFYIVLMIIFALGIFRKRILVLVVWSLLFAGRAYLGYDYFIYNYSKPYLLNLNFMYLVEWSLYFGAGTLYFLYRDMIRFNIAIFVVVALSAALSVFIKPSFALLTYYFCLPYSIFYLAFLPGVFNNFGKNGDFSYGIYIYAYPVQQTIIHYAHGRLGIVPVTVLSFIITLPLAALSWHLVEKRALQFKNYIQ